MNSSIDSESIRAAGGSAASPPATKFAALRREIASPGLAFLMEAHDGLSAKIVEEAGFRGVWASGLTISAAMGLRDSNEASWTQVLDHLEYMADATGLPILVDGDTGHGNFNNVRRFVRKLCERGLAGVCIEDKLFPKTNSFIGEAQPLADTEEFCGRIKAGKDSQLDDDFVLVARVEALRDSADEDWSAAVGHRFVKELFAGTVPDDVMATVKWIGEQGIDDLKARTGVSQSRLELVPLAAQVLAQRGDGGPARTAEAEDGEAPGEGGAQFLQLRVEVFAALRDLVAPFDRAAGDDDVALDDAQREAVSNAARQPAAAPVAAGDEALISARPAPRMRPYRPRERPLRQ